MNANNLHYQEVLEFANMEGLNIDSEENYKEARNQLFESLIQDYTKVNNCDREKAIELLKVDREAKNAERIEEYNFKKEQKVERLRELADKAKAESTSRYKAAKVIGDFIPMGQPILVGHHSERRHRRDIEKIDNNMRKSVEADDKATYYEERIKTVESNNIISSDDPEAIDKLNKKLSELEWFQKLMKDANSIIKKKKLTNEQKVKELVALDLSEKVALELLTPDFVNRIGFPGCKLTNNNANIKRVKERIQKLERMKAQGSIAKELNGLKIVDNVEDNRLQIFFPYKPDEEVRKRLKSCAFRWSPTNGCWQAFRGSNRAEQLANQIFEEHKLQSIER